MIGAHNLQIVISQSTYLKQLNEGLLDGASNGARIVNIVNQQKAEKKLSTVQKLSESEKTEREEPKKRRIKRAPSDKLIDLYQ